MKVLQVHNFYRYPGGEDQVVAAERDLLTGYGHEIIRHQADNDSIAQLSPITAGILTLWNQETYRTVRRLLRAEKPAILHAHNTFPLISPSLYHAAFSEHVPVIQTLHNYRLICPGTNLFRNGGICEECIGAAVPYRAVLHACYRQSRAASAVTASMLAAHRAASTWKCKVHTYIALSEFAKRKFVEGGLPIDRITVKSNFLSQDPGAGPGDGRYALFAGRLVEEKGILTLLDAWERVSANFSLKIAGQGPLEEVCRRRTFQNPRIQWLGYLDRASLLESIKGAELLIFPSIYPDPGPLTILESLACGTPVLASDVESLNTYIAEGKNGFRFRAGNAEHLAERVENLLSQPELLRAKRAETRRSYEQNYTAARNYELLMKIYLDALQEKPAQVSNCLVRAE